MENQPDNQTSHSPTDKAEASAPHTQDQRFYRRHFGLPIALGVILLVLFAFMIGSVISHRGPVAVRSVEFNGDSRPAFGDQMFKRGVRAMNRQGIIGAISKIDGSTVTVHSAAQDYTVSIASTTSIFKAGAIAKQSDLAVGQAVGVAGPTNSSGQIAANTIRIY